MVKPTKLSVVRNEREVKRARELRADLHQSARSIMKDMGTGAIGYALVVWNKEGRFSTVVNASEGPVAGAMVSGYVKDCVQNYTASRLQIEPTT